MFIGLGWLRAAVEKLISRDWWTGDQIREFVEVNSELTLPWFGPVVDALLSIDSIVVVSVFVGQLLAGLALVSGYRQRTGLTIGMTMNLVFVMIGAVDPSIFYLMLQAVLWLWLFEHRVTVATAVRSLTLIGVLAAALAVISAPFISSLDPGKVVEDPATILTTYGISIGIATLVARHRLLNETTDVTTPRV